MVVKLPPEDLRSKLRWTGMAGGRELEPIKYGEDLCQKVKTDFKQFKIPV